MPLGKLCSVSGCAKRTNPSKGFSGFKFPEDDERCYKWILFTQREDILERFKLGDSFRITYIVCADHFEDSAFMNYRKKSLVHDASPTLKGPSKIIFTQEFYMKECCITGCKNGKNATVHCFKFPLERNRHVAWMNFLNMKVTSLEKKDLLQIRRNFQICGNHFEDDAFLGKGRKIISQIAVPTIKYPDMNPKKDNKSTDKGEKKTDYVKPKPLRFKNPLLFEFNKLWKDSPCIEQVTGDSLSSFIMCCSKDCDSTSLDTALFPFPKNKYQAKVWLENCGRSKLESVLEKTGTLPDNFLICEKHFKLENFAVYSEDFKKLTGNAVPHSRNDLTPVTINVVPDIQLLNVEESISDEEMEEQQLIEENMNKLFSNSDVVDSNNQLLKTLNNNQATRHWRKEMIPKNSGAVRKSTRLVLMETKRKSLKDRRRGIMRLKITPGMELEAKKCLMSSVRISIKKLEHGDFNPTFFNEHGINVDRGHQLRTVLARYDAKLRSRKTMKKYYAYEYKKPGRPKGSVKIERDILEEALRQSENTDIYDQTINIFNPSLHDSIKVMRVTADEQGQPSAVNEDDDDFEKNFIDDFDFDESIESMKCTTDDMELDPSDESIEKLEQESITLTKYQHQQARKLLLLQRRVKFLFKPKYKLRDSFKFLNRVLPEDLYGLFHGQVDNCRPIWTYNNLALPVVASRCGPEVYDILKKILKLPKVNSLGRYRTKYRRSDLELPADNIFKRDCDQKTKRNSLGKIFGKQPSLKRRKREPKTVSAMIEQYVKSLEN